MRRRLLLGTVVGWAAVLVLVAACNSDVLPTYEPQTRESSPASQSPAEQTTNTTEQTERPEQTAAATPADDNEEARSAAQLSMPEETEIAPAQAVAEEKPYVPVIRANGSVSPAIIYQTYYDADRESVWTRVSNRVAVEGALNGWLVLEVTCWPSGDLSVDLRGLPIEGWRTGVVRLHIDAGPVETQRWQFVKHFAGDLLLDVSARPPSSAALYQELTNASTLTVEVLDTGVAETTFELAKMFTTPVEGNLRHCGRYVPGRTRPVAGDHTPVRGTRGRTAGGVAWEAIHYGGRVINSSASAPGVAAGADLGVLELAVGCDSRTGGSISVVGLPSFERGFVQAPFQIEGLEPATSTWHVFDVGLITYGIVIDPGFLFYDVLASDSISIDFTQLGLGPVTFDLSDAFTTPIQENLERCGQYHPIFRRELEGTYLPLEWVGGELGPVTRYWAGRDERLQVDSRVTITPTQPDREASSVQMVVGCLDEWQTVVKLTGLPQTELERVTSSMQFDDAEPVSAVWAVENTGDGAEVSSPRAELLQYLLRDVTTLSVEFPELETGLIEFDLTDLYKTPIQPNLDHCGQ